ncbi:MAG: ATP-dependent helicase [Angustibacter sp.]
MSTTSGRPPARHPGGLRHPGGSRFRLRREVLADSAVVLDSEQRAAVGHCGGPVIVLGGPGTGKTTVIVEAVISRVIAGLDPGRVCVLAPTRPAAARVREQLTARLRRTVTEPLARTPQSFAFGVLRLAAAQDGDTPPRLISGPEQDVVLRELLAGHAAGQGTDPGWPERLHPALGTRGFRAELRDLVMRAVERGVDPQELAVLGRQHGRPEWVAGARVLREYLEVTSLATPRGFDPAAIVGAAVARLRSDHQLLAQVRDRVRYVAVDDAQEATPAVADLVRALAGEGVGLMLAGDPDATTLGFRGADPALLLSNLPRQRRRAAGAGHRAPADEPEDGAGRVVRLGTSWRQGEELAVATGAVADRIGAAVGVRHRRPRPAAGLPRGEVQVQVTRSVAHQVAVIVEHLRRHHLVAGVPWRQMAVIVRGTQAAARLRRGLAIAGVPVDVPLTEIPVREQPAVVPLLDAFDLSLRIAGWAARRGPGHHPAGHHPAEDHPAEDHPAGRPHADWLPPDVVPVDRVQALLQSPVGAADALGVRRLRRALLEQERAGGGRRSADELVICAVLEPALLAVLDPRVASPARRVAGVLAAGVAAVRDGSAPAPAKGSVTGSAQWPAGGAVLDRSRGESTMSRPERAATGSVETVLWAIWSASRLADPWRRAAMGGGPAAARADRDLDAVVALFDAAARFTDRLPRAGPHQFLEYLRGQEVPGDSLVERGSRSGTVSVLTPASAAGRQWQVVVVAGVQDGSWPDLRPRGTLLGAQHLADVLAGWVHDGTAARATSASGHGVDTHGADAHGADAHGADAHGADASGVDHRSVVRNEETRLFHVAVSRASRWLLVTAVRDEEEQPSVFLDLIDPDQPLPSDPGPRRTGVGRTGAGGPGAGGPGAVGDVRPLTAPPTPLTLAGAVARLRQVVTDERTSRPVAAAAARQLARLARAGVPGADPDDWGGLAPVSDIRALGTDRPVRVSPSAVEAFDRCALRWLLQRSGGRSADSTGQGLGVLVHALAADLPDASVDQLQAELRRRWSVLGLSEGWVGDVVRARAERVVSKLAAYVATTLGGRELVGTELELDVEVPLPSGPARLVGRVDRLERDAHGLHVVDLKTSATAVPGDQVPEHPQLGIYQLAIHAGAFRDLTADPNPAADPADAADFAADPARVSSGATLVQLGTPTKRVGLQRQPPLPDDGGWAWQLLAQVAEGMAGHQFPATPQEHCDRCPVRTSCPARGEGRRVVS